MILRQTTIFLHIEHMKKLKVLAESQGLQSAQLVRVAIADYLSRSARKHK
jgi:predicted DNA-binding protein